MSFVAYSSLTATIALNQTKSGEVNTKGLQPIGIQLPAAFTGTSISFERAKASGGTFGPVQNVSGTGLYSVPCAAGQYIPLDPIVMLGINFLKVVSGSSEVAARDIEVVCIPVAH
jgi:hypothetical protein